jgi:hypothetical protein
MQSLLQLIPSWGVAAKTHRQFKAYSYLLRQPIDKSSVTNEPSTAAAEFYAATGS